MTKKELQDKLAVAEERLRKAMLEQGEACGDACDWHDNNAYDLATSLTNTYQEIVNDLKSQLKKMK